MKYREREMRGFREDLLRREGLVHLLAGIPGVGVSRFLREAILPFPHRLLTLPPLAEGDLLRLLDALLAEGGPVRDETGTGSPGPTPSWESLLSAASAHAPSLADRRAPPFILAIDDAHRLLRVDPGLPRTLADFFARRGMRALPFHLVLAGTSPPDFRLFAHAFEERFRRQREPAPLLETLLPLLPYRAVGSFAPWWSARERLLGWTLFGSLPARFEAMREGMSPGDAVRTLVLDPGGPLQEAPSFALEESFRAPARYGSVLRAIAGGKESWGEIGAALGEGAGSARIGPYLRNLEERGWVRVERPLDTRDSSRNRRYRIPDPFVLFWFSEILPLLPLRGTRSPAELRESELAPRLDRHFARLFPMLCREWAIHHAEEMLGSPAREVGELEAGGHPLPVGGTLGNGAVFFGDARWGGANAPPMDLEELARLDRAVRATSYGFARERRHRILFGEGSVTPRLAARVGPDPDLHVAGVKELAGDIRR